jgi:hypothetical protein
MTRFSDPAKRVRIVFDSGSALEVGGVLLLLLFGVLGCIKTVRAFTARVRSEEWKERPGSWRVGSVIGAILAFALSAGAIAFVVLAFLYGEPRTGSR